MLVQLILSGVLLVLGIYEIYNLMLGEKFNSYVPIKIKKSTVPPTILGIKISKI